MATFIVHEEQGSYLISRSTEEDDLNMELLLYRYPEGDCDNPYDEEKMLSCLYDLYQTEDDIKEGDRFETPLGNFFCWSVHVSKEGEF